ncbi:MAG: hypothetical protein HY938_01370 [Nitrosomonadales bacterium]|nr:hypothetical protein [Nitrosomonadales bacterium]
MERNAKGCTKLLPVSDGEMINLFEEPSTTMLFHSVTYKFFTRMLPEKPEALVYEIFKAALVKPYGGSTAPQDSSDTKVGSRKSTARQKSSIFALLHRPNYLWFS